MRTAPALEAASPAKRGQGLQPPFGALTRLWLLMALVLGLGAAYGVSQRIYTTETWFLLRQDLPVACVGLAVLAALALAPKPALARLAQALERPRPWVWGLTGLCFVAGCLGPRLVFGGYVFSLDEVMANFDAAIFDSGRLVAPIAPAWRDFADAMQPIFMLPALGDHAFWASSYLPVNAGMRALAGLVHGAWLVNPLLSAFSIVAVWAVGRRLWPDAPKLALVAAVLLGTSSQLVVTAMTAYAMPAHLAFYLAWLWLFLRGGRLGHAGAIVVGFLACGIHQLAFHPLFVAPFVLQLWLDRRWGLAGLYTLAYALICLFWVEYWPLEMRLIGAPSAAGHAAAGWFLDRVLSVLQQVQVANLGPMALCLVRFVAWQNLLLVPLALAAAVPALRAGGTLRALALGVILTLVVMTLLMPTQTHGWGYRYLHGLLGSVALLAAWGWSRLTADLSADSRAAANGALAAASIVSALLIPLHAWQTFAYVRPYARASAAIARSPADVVVVQSSGPLAFNFGTEVRNDPFLRDRPKTLALEDMDEDLVRELCARHSVAVFDGSSAAAFGIDTVRQAPDADAVALRRLMGELGCGASVIQPRAGR